MYHLYVSRNRPPFRNIIISVLTVLIVKFHFKQYSFNLSNESYKPVSLSDKITASSAKSNKYIDNWLISIPQWRLFCKWTSISFRKRENMIGEVTSPCNKPKLLSNKSEILPICLTHSLTSEYMDLSTRRSLPSIPLFINLNHSAFLSIKLYALRKSIKQANSFFLLLNCLSIIEFEIKAASTVPKPDQNPN